MWLCSVAKLRGSIISLLLVSSWTNGGFFSLLSGAQCQAIGRVKEFQAEELIATLAFLEASSIVGSSLRSPAEVLAFRRRWQCLASRHLSSWQLDPTPRVIPWASPDLQFANYQNLGGMNATQVNEAVKRGEYHNFSLWPMPERVKYEWVLRPGNEGKCGRDPPSFAKTDVPKLCSALRRSGGSLVFVGDSITATFVQSFIAELSALGEPIRALEPSSQCKAQLEYLKAKKAHALGCGNYPTCARWMICGEDEQRGGVVMHYLASCYLQWVHSDVPKELYVRSQWCEDLRQFPFGERMVEEKASVVVLNRGLHFVEREIFFQQLNYTLSELRRMLPKALLLYRSAFTGHPNCSEYERPLDKPLDLSPSPYHWDLLPEENELAKALVQSQEVQGVYLDLEQMNSLRPDGHRSPNHNDDCLHYLIPGPTSTWVRFFSALVVELL